MKLKINITRDVLERSHMCGYAPGKLTRSENCAIAIAIRDLLPEAMVDVEAIWINRERANSFSIEIELPWNATDFILSFDNLSPGQRLLMKPFSFTIDIPEEVIEEIGIQEVEAILSDHPYLESV